ncbi:hypothetical protein SAY87_029477 [Trapa incisa]|uniref:Protein transport protein sec16 n=1 Tax=Trapa incisa TaxID=236973 RepID=A0AAN7K4I8_9MYRT|nr:hypothetical protein SAY87_029477 [Trapa incisa]
MASNPPFDMEDLTDEDFFDNLVNDEDELKNSKPAPQSGPSVAHTFSNLSIKESGGEDEPKVKQRNDSVDFDDGSLDASIAEVKKVLPSSNSFDFDNVVEPEVNTGIENLMSETVTEAIVKQDLADAGSELPSAISESGNTLASSNSFEFDTLTATNNKRLESEGMVELFKSKNLSSPGEIKEVGWNAFHADSMAHSGSDGFGSYSNFFMDLGNSVEFPGNTDNYFNSESNTVINSVEYVADCSGSTVSHTQYDGGQGYEVGSEQSAIQPDMSSANYWESMYPGWRYDSDTGTWYQVEGNDANVNVQGSPDYAAVNEYAGNIEEKADVSYLQQTTQSVAGSFNEVGATETVSNWNHVPEGNNGYPEHMFFDPQYPGWYYDMIAQEWRTLDSYTSINRSENHSHNYQNQNGLDAATDVTQNDGNNISNYGQNNSYTTQGFVGENQDNVWAGQSSQHNADYGWPEQPQKYDGKSDASYVSTANNCMETQMSLNSFAGVASYDMPHQSQSKLHGSFSMQSFIPSEPTILAPVEQRDQGPFSNDIYGIQTSTSFSQPPFQTPNDFSHVHTAGRSSAGRPAHVLVRFGFGGKVIVMKGASNLSFGTQDSNVGSIKVINIMETMQKNDDVSNSGFGILSYFHALCHQSFPGPLVGGNVGNKELNKWTDERIGYCDSSGLDYRKAETLRLLLSLLKIAYQHYGKLRSPFGTDPLLKEGDSPEVSVAKLFASATRNGGQFSDYGGQRQCMQPLPPTEQVQETAYEVQNLLVSGKKTEALQRAQDGQLWGPALVLASQLGDQYYIDTVKQMALHQLVPGSPLRTLCLLIAGQPAEVFSAETTTAASVVHALNMNQQPPQSGGNRMLERWEENLAIITANRTKDDELVIMHLGDCLWKDQSENMAAHLCYLVAEANFESYSDSARLCLVGADHWKCPRTYASPEAIQRTELYEYSKVLGNSQFILLPFQPYKIIYAHMLAEVGKISDSLKYCQALLKSLKTGRAPEIEMWKQVVASLEERIKIHQQGGYSANLAPAKLVGKLLNFFDSTAQRVVNSGGLPPVPSSFQAVHQGSKKFNGRVDHKVPNNQAPLAMPPLAPSLSMEPISEWTGHNSRTIAHNRSVSEPDFGRSPRQEASSASGDKTSTSGTTSRFARFGFGSQLFQKTVGLVMRSRSDRQAKLGETNKFYYDEKLKRWVEEGAEPPAEEASLSLPPTSAAFQNGADYNLKSAIKNEGFVPNGTATDFKSPSKPSEQNSGTPPLHPSLNQFSSRGRMGIRARYVDTFNKSGGTPANLFQPPSAPAVKPAATSGAPKFFIPSPVAASTEQQQMESTDESAQEKPATNETTLTSADSNPVSSSSAYSEATTIHRFPSMGNIPRGGSMVDAHSTVQPSSRRTVSWSGNFNDIYSPNKNAGMRPHGERLIMPPLTLMPGGPPPIQTPTNGGGSLDELQEVEL